VAPRFHTATAQTPQQCPFAWCNPGVFLPQISVVAMGGPVSDSVRSTTTKPNTDHDPHQ